MKILTKGENGFQSSNLANCNGLILRSDWITRRFLSMAGSPLRASLLALKSALPDGIKSPATR